MLAFVFYFPLSSLDKIILNVGGGRGEKLHAINGFLITDVDCSSKLKSSAANARISLVFASLIQEVLYPHCTFVLIVRARTLYLQAPSDQYSKRSRKRPHNSKYLGSPLASRTGTAGPYRGPLDIRPLQRTSKGRYAAVRSPRTLSQRQFHLSTGPFPYTHVWPCQGAAGRRKYRGPAVGSKKS